MVNWLIGHAPASILWLCSFLKCVFRPTLLKALQRYENQTYWLLVSLLWLKPVSVSTSAHKGWLLFFIKFFQSPNQKLLSTREHFSYIFDCRVTPCGFNAVLQFNQTFTLRRLNTAVLSVFGSWPCKMPTLPYHNYSSQSPWSHSPHPSYHYVLFNC